MITPDEIRKKAQRLYPQAIAAWLANESFFPRAMPVNLKPAELYSEAMRQEQLLRSESKEVRGYGYSVEWESRNSRMYGKQNFALKIFFETQDDLLRLVGRVGEFKRLMHAIETVERREPRLIDWARTNWKRLLAIDSALVPLLDVAEYYQTNPRPGCYLRELPLAISTKLVEENFSTMAQWLDTLSPQVVDYGFDRQQFALRYGFREVGDQLLFRILDPTLLGELQCPGPELSLPVSTLNKLPIRDVRVILVENKINLLTLPAMERTIAMGGLGNGIGQLFQIEWLCNFPIYYWGDIDIEGFQILARVRNRLPQTRSLMMSMDTLQNYLSLAISGNNHDACLAPPAELTADEITVFEYCRDHTLRLEQERIPQSTVVSWIT